MIRLQCYEGIDAAQALYDWDFPRQILCTFGLRHRRPGPLDWQRGGAEKNSVRRRASCWRAVAGRVAAEPPAVLLIDEVDRADDEFEAFLLEVLSTYQVTIPELGTVRAATPPIVLTSNRTRELHDALKRRCLYHWIDHPGLERELEIVRSRAPEVSEALGRQVVSVVQQLRDRDDLQKPPGVAETLDWARALHHLGTAELDLASAAATLGALVKYREDAERVRQAPGPDAHDMSIGSHAPGVRSRTRSRSAFRGFPAPSGGCRDPWTGRPGLPGGGGARPGPDDQRATSAPGALRCVPTTSRG